MKINPNIEIVVQKYIQKYLIDNKFCSIKDLIRHYNNFIPTTEAELRNGINNALKNGNIIIIDKKIPIDESIVNLSKPFLFNEDFKISIVISRPRFKELSTGCIEKRNLQIDSIDCFSKIISSSNRILRICSPFIQKNVLNDDCFPELRELIKDALDRNVEIRLLSRELYQGRGDEINWIVDIAKDADKEDKLTIVDYHLSDQNQVISSTHAKLLIADNNIAYIGSAELRRNSLVTNFEVGCMVSGIPVFGICEVFDSIFLNGRVWQQI